ncbi:aminotransferase class V-fold PLP-dependent enzyme, partial [Myxococcota bacterium]|nr:aminotransferase class V-fold PLP-dependent enzyme [Myxococcota bacterium]
REHEVPFHTDAAQAVGRAPIDVGADLIDLLSLSGHKIYGPKGIGALFVRRRRSRVTLAPRQFGGGHEAGLRPGTLPVPLVVGLARALEICAEERDQENERLIALRRRLYERIREGVPEIRLNGHSDQRLAGNLNLAFAGIDGARLLLALRGVAVSSGSACASAKPEPSHVLRAIGLSEKQARSSLRFGLGRWTTAEEIDRAAELVISAVNEVRGSRLTSQ